MNRLTEKVKNTDDYIKLPTKDKQEFINKLGKIEDLMQSYNVKDLEELDKLLTMATSYEELSKQIGCPLDVRCKVVNNTSIFAEQEYGLNSNEWLVNRISSVGFECQQLYRNVYITRIHFWEDYKKTWWLKEDKSE